MQDTSGNGNHLANNGCTRNTSEIKEGIASCEAVSGSDRILRVDSSLSSDFPGKNGQGNTSWSFVGWVYWDTSFLGSGDTFSLASKYVTNKRQYLLQISNDAGTHKVQLSIGYNNGVSFEAVIEYTGLTFAADQWYHCAFTYDGPTKAGHIRIWDESGTTVHDDTATGAQTISDAEDQAFIICNNGFLSSDKADSAHYKIGLAKNELAAFCVSSGFSVRSNKTLCFSGQNPLLTASARAASIISMRKSLNLLNLQFY